MDSLLPVARVCETQNLVAFHHPRPSHRLHILLLPRRAIRSLDEIGPEDAGFVMDLFATVRHLVVEFGLEAYGYRLVANGGNYQEVPHLHFHLISEMESGAPG
jgi:histidine triad (HIT) family protein